MGIPAARPISSAFSVQNGCIASNIGFEPIVTEPARRTNEHYALEAAIQFGEIKVRIVRVADLGGQSTSRGGFAENSLLDILGQDSLASSMIRHPTCSPGRLRLIV